MPNKLMAAALCCATAVILFSCKKETPGTQPAISKNEVFSGLKSSAQVLTVQAGTAQTIYGKDGTMLRFYPNSFKDKNGNTITGGTVSIELVEMYKPAQMILNWASTVTKDNAMLKSGGQVYINATKNGQKIFANKYGIGFKQSAYTSEAMQLFYGNTKTADSVVTWTMADTTQRGTTATIKDTIISAIDPMYFIFDSCTDFTWINCDHAISGTCTNIRLPFSDPSFNYVDMLVYCIYPELNSVMNVYPDITGTYLVRNAPIGKTYKVVAFAVKNGYYYYYESPLGTVSTDLIITATMTADSYSSIKSKLSAL